MASYLVTGGCGFIGSHLCERLIGLGHKVQVLDNLSTGTLNNLPQDAEFINGDVRDLDLIIRLLNHTDGCFHLAAIASVQICNDDWVNAHHVNLSGTINIFEAARRASYKKFPIPVVYTSSAAVYGDLTTLPLSEEMAAPISVYGVNKFACESYAHLATSLYGVPTVGLRLFNVYGPRQNPNSSYTGVITKFIHNINENEPLTIYGDGKQSRDFIYVEDVVKFYIQSMDRQFNDWRVYNVCTGMSISIKEIGDLLSQLKNVGPHYIYKGPKPGDIYHSLGSPEYAYKNLNIKATVPLKEGLLKLIMYSDDNHS
jgi:UDP-glucose 4-epimerase